MKRTIALALSVFALVAMAAPVSQAGGTYRCTKPAGCVARKAKSGGGQMAQRFRKGDLISTKEGWIVNPEDGWDKQRSSKKHTSSSSF